MSPTHKSLPRPQPDQPRPKRGMPRWLLGAVIVFVAGVTVGYFWQRDDPAPTGMVSADQVRPTVDGFDEWIDDHPVFGVTPESAAQAKAVARDVCYSLEDGFGSFGMVLFMLMAGAQPPPGLDSRQVEELILEFMGQAIAEHCPQHTDGFDAWVAGGAEPDFYDGLLPDGRPGFDVEDAEETMRRLEKQLEEDFGFRFGE